MYPPSLGATLSTFWSLGAGAGAAVQFAGPLATGRWPSALLLGTLGGRLTLDTSDAPAGGDQDGAVRHRAALYVGGRAMREEIYEPRTSKTGLVFYGDVANNLDQCPLPLSTRNLYQPSLFKPS